MLSETTVTNAELEDQNPHPAAKNAARMGHPRVIRCWRTADSSCLASLARRNDTVRDSYFCGVYFRGYSGFPDWDNFVDCCGLG
jgi:hypothetical protein